MGKRCRVLMVHGPLRLVEGGGQVGAGRADGCEVRFHLQRVGARAKPFPICSLSFSISLIPDTLFSMPAPSGPQCAPCKVTHIHHRLVVPSAAADTILVLPPLGPAPPWLPRCFTQIHHLEPCHFPQQPHLFGHLGGNCGTLARAGKGAGPLGRRGG